MRRATAAAGAYVAVVAAAALCIFVVSQSSVDRAELAQAAKKKASDLPAVPGLGTQPVNPAATKKLFAYLSADSYTPQV